MKNIYWIGSSLKYIAYDIETPRNTDFDIIVETNYPKKFEEFLEKILGRTVYRNSFGGLKMYSKGGLSIDIIVINTKLKNVYKNFVEFNFDSFIYDVLKDEFVFFDNLYEESLNSYVRVGNVLHPTLGAKRSIQREVQERAIENMIAYRKDITIKEAFKNLDRNFLGKNNREKNIKETKEFINFIEALKKF